MKGENVLQELRKEMEAFASRLYMKGYRAGYKAGSRRKPHQERDPELPLPNDLEEK